MDCKDHNAALRAGTGFLPGLKAEASSGGFW
jgi:hypothetical protein